MTAANTALVLAVRRAAVHCLIAMRPPDLIKRCACPERTWAKCPPRLARAQDGATASAAGSPWTSTSSPPTIRSVAEAVAARETLLRDVAGRTLWPRHGPARRAAGPVTLAELAARYARAQAENPDRAPTYHGNLRACLALITAAPLGALPVAAVTDDLLEAPAVRPRAAGL